MKSIITFIGVAICTALLYHLIYEEHTTLFYVNVVVTWLTEGILLLNIPVFSNTKLLDFKNAASLTILNSASIILLLWTIGYSLFTEEQENLENLYIGMLIISIIFIIALGITEIGGSAMKKQEAQLNTTIQKRKWFVRFLVQNSVLYLRDQSHSFLLASSVDCTLSTSFQ